MQLFGSRLLDDPLRLAALASAAALLEAALAEREPQPRLYAGLLTLLEAMLADPRWRETYVRFELLLLQELGFALDLAAWHLGILQTKVANATLFGNSASLLLVIWTIVVTRAWPRGWQALAILLAFAGSALLMGQSYELSPAYLVGDLLSLLAGVLYTGYVILMQRVRGTVAPWTALSIASFVCVPILLGTALALGERVMPHDWSPLILLALTSQIVGQGLMTWSLPRFSPLVIGLTLLVQPAIAAFAGWIVFDELLGLGKLCQIDQKERLLKQQTNKELCRPITYDDAILQLISQRIHNEDTFEVAKKRLHV